MDVSTRRAISLQSLAKHKERVMQMVQRIEQYRPTFHLNRQYRRDAIERRIEQRERESDKLFQENMKLIYRIETTGPKIQTKKFPEIKNNPSRLKVLSAHALKSAARTRPVVKDAYRNEDELFEENMKLITNIECTGPKIQCWTPKKTLNLNALVRLKKQEEERKILQKFKEISKQLGKLSRVRSFRKSPSNSSLHPSLS